MSSRMTRARNLPSARFPLLVFFNALLVLFGLYVLLTALLPASGLYVSLPRFVSSVPLSPRAQAVVIRADGAVYVDQTARRLGHSDLDDFFGRLKGENVHVMIKADKRARIADLVLVWDAARKAQVAQVSIVTNE